MVNFCQYGKYNLEVGFYGVTNAKLMINQKLYIMIVTPKS